MDGLDCILLVVETSLCFQTKQNLNHPPMHLYQTNEIILYDMKCKFLCLCRNGIFTQIGNAAVGEVQG